jgi:hypothetical protein
MLRSITILAFFFLVKSCCAQIPDSTSQKLTYRKLIVPTALMTTGFLTLDELDFVDRYKILDHRIEHSRFFDLHVDDYLQYTPIALVYTLGFSGVEGKNNLAEKTMLLVKSELLMGITVHILKTTTHVSRPDNSTYNSFPSGHTAQAFVAATFLHKEYGHKSIWYSIGGYTAATTVGVMRVLGNRHWLADVFVGGAIGILSTEVVYATHQYKWSKRRLKLTALPSFQSGSRGLYLCLSL